MNTIKEVEVFNPKTKETVRTVVHIISNLPMTPRQEIIYSEIKDNPGITKRQIQNKYGYSNYEIEGALNAIEGKGILFCEDDGRLSIFVRE